MFRFRVSASIMLFVLSLSSCQLPFSSSDNRDTPSSGSEIIRLGNKKVNPFSLMTARALKPGVEANRLYIRVRSNDPALLQHLFDKYPNLQTTPLDYEVLEGGVSYDDPLVDEAEEVSWAYLMITPDESAALVAAGFDVEVLEEMYVDEKEMAAISESEPDSFNRGLARDLPGEDREKPRGHLYVWDSVNQVYKPLRKAKIVANQWLTESTDYTDSAGYYKIGTTFSSLWGKVRLRVFFDNSQAVINRNITENFAQYLWAAEYLVGEYSVSRLDNKDIYLAPSSTQARLGTVLKAVDEYESFASDNGITVPDKLKIMTFRDDGGKLRGVTPMTRYTTTEIFWGIVPALGGAFGGIPGAIGAWGGGLLLQSELPDVIINIGSGTNGESYTEAISNTVYHEMAHASHEQATGGSWFGLWWNEYRDMIGGGGGYASTPLVNLVESWGFFMGDYLTLLKYPASTVIDYQSRLEQADRADMNEGVYFDLIDDTATENTPYYDPSLGYSTYNWDNCGQYTLRSIFAGLKDGDTRSLKAYRNDFISKNAVDSVTIPAIDAVFHGNGITW